MKATSATEEMILNQNDKAPYDGVLIPESNYREYQSLEKQLTFINEKYEDSVQVCTRCDDTGIIGTGTAFITGMLSGALLIILLSR